MQNSLGHFHPLPFLPSFIQQGQTCIIVHGYPSVSRSLPSFFLTAVSCNKILTSLISSWQSCNLDICFLKLLCDFAGWLTNMTKAKALKHTCIFLCVLALCHLHEKDTSCSWSEEENERLMEQDEVTPIFPSEGINSHWSGMTHLRSLQISRYS